MHRFRRLMPLSMILMGTILFFGVSPPAQATFQLQFTTSAGTTTLTDTDGDGQISFSGNLGGFSIFVFLSTSNSPGTGSLAQLAVGSLDLTNTLGTSNTINVRVVDQGYTTGTSGSSMSLASSLSGTVTQSGAGNVSTVTYQSFADAANNPLATFPFATAFSTNPLTATLTSVGVSQPFSLNTSKSGFVDPSLPFSMGSKLDITLSGGASLNAVSGKTEMVVPVPASLALVATGLPCFGLAYGVRRRRAATQP
jgi:hypothetical protein